jgi:hypothetical protein
MEQCQQFPSFLGIGTQKGGTTTLHRLLLQHPQVYLPAAKELQFFSLHYALGEAWYADQFAAAAPGQRCGEITPYYLFHPEAPRRIAGLLPAVKLVVLLRDPVERTLSQVFHSRRLGLEPLELEAALAAEAERLQGVDARLVAVDGRDRSHQEHSYLARSRYEQQLARYRQHFAADQLLILRSEDLFSRPEACWLQLQIFLGVDPQPLPLLHRANAGAEEAAAVPLALRQQLRAALAPTYRALETRYGLVWP